MAFGSAVKNYSQYYYKHPFARVSKKNAPIETQRVYPVLSAEQLLKAKGRRKVVDQIRTQCGAPTEYFNALYKELIDNYVEFVQNLPMVKNHRLCRLDRQLHIASLALSLREPYVLAGQLLNRTTDAEKALWNYVVFSSLLLGRLGEIVKQYDVILCNEKGVFQKVWEPFIGSMNGQGDHFKIRGIHNKSSRIDEQLNVLLAKQLMPEDGYLWIASYPEALEEWILGLQGSGEEGAGGLVAEFYAVLEKWLLEQNKVRELEDKELYDEYLEELLEQYILEHDQSADFTSLYSGEPSETMMGERFYQWLRDGVQNGSISVNQMDSAVFATAQGVLLLHPEIFDKFQAANPSKFSSDQLFDQFSKLGLIANNKLESYVSKFPGMKEQNVQGVLLKDPTQVFGVNNPPPLTQNLIRANVLKRASEQRTTQETMQEQQSKEAQQKAKDADLSAKEQYPDLRFSEQSQSKTPSSTNKPPRRGGY